MNSRIIVFLRSFFILVCALTIALVLADCNRKVGVKPGGRLKIDKSKCKCKKKSGGIYGEVILPNTTYYSNRLFFEKTDLF